MMKNPVEEVNKSVTDSERIAQLEEELKREKASHAEDIRILKAQIEELMKRYTEALEEIARLKSMLNNNSSNTSLPPSTDRKGTEKSANRYNGRVKSEKKVGGQTGHKGKTLTKAEVAEKLASGQYKHEVIEIGERRDGPYLTKYELDLEITPVIREIRIYADADGALKAPERYYSDVTYGDTVKALTLHLYGSGVMSNDRIAAFLNEVGGADLGVSEGSVYGFCARFARKAESTIALLEREQSMESVLCTDATCTTTNGKRSYIRCVSSKAAVIFYAMERKTVAALEKIELLAGFQGILMHDHETALYHFGQGHAECNVHILRYLRKNGEDAGNGWSEAMIALLTEMNGARKALIAAGRDAFEPEELQEYEEKYRKTIAEGREQNQKTAHEYAKQKEAALLNRLDKYRDNHLLFLHRFDVPFDDNMSERDLRKAKNRQKMTGGFRKPSGLDMYCKIMTVIETAKRKKVGIMDSIKNIFAGSSAVFQAV